MYSCSQVPLLETYFNTSDFRKSVKNPAVLSNEHGLDEVEIKRGAVFTDCI